MENPNAQLDAQNRLFISNFLVETSTDIDDISGSVIATIAQFLMNYRRNICNKAIKRDWVTPVEIIDAQVEELRRCVIDLEAYKQRLKKGVTTQ